MTTAYTTPSGEVCPHCGAPLMVGVAELFGKKHRMNLACSCPKARAEYDPPKPTKPPTRAERYAKAGIAPEYQAIRLGCEKYTEAIKAGRNVFLCGENGTGKTALAASIAMNLIDEGVNVVFVNAAIEAQRIKSDFSSQEYEYDRMVNAPVLVLDDIGKGNTSDWEISLWYCVCEARDMAGVPTLTTTNYDGGELIRRLTVNGDDSTAKAIVSRLKRDALTYKAQGRDMRVAKR